MVTPFDPDKVGDPNAKKGRRGRRSSNAQSMSPQRGGNVGGDSATDAYGSYDLGYGTGASARDAGFDASPYGGGVGGGGFNDIGDNQYGGGGYDQRPGGARGRR